MFGELAKAKHAMQVAQDQHRMIVESAGADVLAADDDLDADSVLANDVNSVSDDSLGELDAALEQLLESAGDVSTMTLEQVQELVK